MLGRNVPLFFSVGGLDQSVVSWALRVSAAGGVVAPTRLDAVDRFVKRAKAGGYWSAIARLNLFVGDAAASLVPLVNRLGSALDTNVGTTYSESTGRASTGVTQYINTGLIPSESVGGLFVYLRTDQPAVATSYTIAGANNSGFTQSWSMRANVNNGGILTAGAYVGGFGSSVAAHSAGQASNVGGMGRGLWHINRRGNANLVLWKNAALDSFQFNGASNASTGQPIYLFCLNNNGTASSGVVSGTSFGAYGYADSGFSDQQMADLYSNMQAFQTELGRQV